MPTSEYADVLASLYRLENAKGMDFKLERVALALKNLGDPHKAFPAVHIAGTGLDMTLSQGQLHQVVSGNTAVLGPQLLGLLSSRGVSPTTFAKQMLDLL